MTGNAWDFPIDKAVVTVHLPPGTRIVQSAAYTGPQGAQGKDFRVVSEAPGLYKAETTRTFSPGEGFTIAVAFPKGVLTPPSTADKTGAFVSDNAGIVAVILGVLAAFLYYLYAWMKVGRDPPKGVIVPLFSPPTGMGPAGRALCRQARLRRQGLRICACWTGGQGLAQDQRRRAIVSR